MNPEDDDRTIIRPPGGPRTGQIPASPAAAPGTAYPPTQTMPATIADDVGSDLHADDGAAVGSPPAARTMR